MRRVDQIFTLLTSIMLNKRARRNLWKAIRDSVRPTTLPMNEWKSLRIKILTGKG